MGEMMIGKYVDEIGLEREVEELKGVGVDVGG